MFGARWRLFNLFGIPLYLDLSWLIILFLMSGSLMGLYTERIEGLNRGVAMLLGLITALAFFTCIVLHELGHAIVARATGLPVRRITLFLFGGVAELSEEPKSAGSEFVMAIAGPIVSAVLGAAFFLVATVGTAQGWSDQVTLMFSLLGSINLSVLVFNLVPAFPLDGGRVLRSILWGTTGDLRRATYWASLLGRGFAWFLMGVGVFLAIMGNLWSGIWLGIIGLFLNSAARSSYQQLLLRQGLEGETVRRFMNPDPIVVPPTLDLHHWVDDYVYRYHRKAFPVVADGRLEGIVTTQALSRFPRNEWDQHTVGEAATHDLAEVSISPDADALHALTQMQRTGLSRLLVVDGERLVGIVSLKDLMRFLNMKLELDDHADRRSPHRRHESVSRRQEHEHPTST
jgi:Zn-dependent protease/CBS domain-containing protein